jgi:hypothetical protein
MKKKWALIAAVMVGLALLAFYLWLPGSVPAGQQPLTRLRAGTMTQFERAFDANADMTQVVLLLSPT